MNKQKGDEEQKTTTLTIFLSTGNKVDVYYEGEIFDSLYDELKDTVNKNYPFLIGNWNYSQACIYDVNGTLLFNFYKDDECPLIDSNKIIGWNIQE